MSDVVNEDDVYEVRAALSGDYFQEKPAEESDPFYVKAEELIATDTFSLQVFDYGLQAYNYSINRA